MGVQRSPHRPPCEAKFLLCLQEQFGTCGLLCRTSEAQALALACASGECLAWDVSSAVATFFCLK